MTGTVLHAFAQRCAHAPDAIALRVLASGGARAEQALTWSDWNDAAAAFAAALIHAGHGVGDVVAIFADNDLIWPVADVGILRARLVSAGVYPTSAPEQVRAIVAACGARTIVTGSAHQLAAVRAIVGELPDVTLVIAGGMHAVADAAAAAGARLHAVSSWDEWQRRGAEALRDPAIRAELSRREHDVGPDDTALLIYTSGSTGEPKGACIPHRCLQASVDSIGEVLHLGDSDTSLSFLPYSHSAERIFGLYARIAHGMQAGIVADHTRLWDAARDFGPTVFGGLPRFYEKTYETLEAERAAAGEAERARWDRVLELGRRRSSMRQAGAPVPPALEAEWRTLGEPVFRRVRAHFGGRVRVATSGGATLPQHVAEYLDALGLTVLGAYGLTEHLCAAFHRPDDYAFDSVGRAMPGTELRMADDGEIMIRRSDLTFTGYYRAGAATAEAFTGDGAWLLTGDLGRIDERGFLHVTGRKKELIALSTGRKVAPVPIETRLVQTPWIAQAVLHGEGRKYITALVTLRRGVLEEYARRHELAHDWPALIRSREVSALVQSAIDEVNAGLSNPERIRRFVILASELSVGSGELTPTMKVKRHAVAERYRDQLEALYP